MKRRSVAVACIVCMAVIIVIGAALPGDTQEELPFTPFQKVPNDQPVITSGFEGWPAFMSDPCVIKDEEGYHLFVTNLFFEKDGRYWYSYDPRNPGKFNLARHAGTIAYAFSGDQGLTWTLRKTPCVMPGPEAWQDDDLETPFVLKDGDRLILFYSALGSRNGKQFNSRYQIGAATLDLHGKSIRENLLDESVLFTKRTAPVLPHETRVVHWNNNTQEPSAILKNGEIELFYIGLTLKKPDQPIGGVPGQGISKVALYQAILDRDLNLVQAAAGPAMEGANITEVHYRNGAYHVFSTKSAPWYAGYPGKAEKLDAFHYNDSITYYHSADGTHWSRPEIILKRGSAQSFDDWGVMAPTVVFEDDRVVMFYTAWQLGHQTMNPLPPDGRFGSSHGQSRVIWGTLGRAEAAYKPPQEPQSQQKAGEESGARRIGETN